MLPRQAMGEHGGASFSAPQQRFRNRERKTLKFKSFDQVIQKGS